MLPPHSSNVERVVAADEPVAVELVLVEVLVLAVELVSVEVLVLVVALASVLDPVAAVLPLASVLDPVAAVLPLASVVEPVAVLEPEAVEALHLSGKAGQISVAMALPDGQIIGPSVASLQTFSQSASWQS
jgi:hypothetical protein